MDVFFHSLLFINLFRFYPILDLIDVQLYMYPILDIFVMFREKIIRKYFKDL